MRDESASFAAARWSWKVGRLFGTDVRLNATLIVLMIWTGWRYWLDTAGMVGAFASIAFPIALLLSVLSHEFGHVLTARWLRLQTRELTLLPFGGVPTPTWRPRALNHEVAIALAGPVVSLVIAIDLFIALWFSGRVQSFSGMTLFSGPFFERMMVANIALAVFNLLPVLPMDGGRVIRAWLATRMSRARATKVTARLGQVMSVAIGGVGLFVEPVLIVIAVATWIGAVHEMHDAHPGVDNDQPTRARG